MTYYQNVLDTLLQARSLTKATLSRRLELTEAQLQHELDRSPEPKQSIIKAIAKELVVPVFTFYMRKLPEVDNILLDFRSENPEYREKTRETLESIEFSKGIQNTAKLQKTNRAKILPHFQIGSNKDVARFALAIREHLGISIEDQTESRDDKVFYVLCRKKIESHGIFVLHDSFPREDGSGYCLSDPKHPVIVINTKNQTQGRRLFTLIHELAHVLMGVSGISDPFVRRNDIERACNRFAGYFLVPKRYAPRLLGNLVPAKEPGTDDVRAASRKLKISQEATVLRLEQLGYYSEGSYANWKRLVSNSNPDNFRQGGGSGKPPEQEKVKLAKYGFNFAKIFGEMLNDSNIDEINLYRVSGLKPKYQKSYFDFVKTITDADLGEIADE